MPILGTHKALSWQGVYYHYRKWAKDGSFKRVWVELLKSQQWLLVLSCVQLDASQTICKLGGDGVSEQKSSQELQHLVFSR